MTDRNEPDSTDDHPDYLDAGLPPDVRADSTTRIDIEGPPPIVEKQTTSLVPPGSVPTVVEPSGISHGNSWVWPLINLAGLIVVIAMNYAANSFEFNGQSTGDVVNKAPVPFQPAGWVFAIWGVIYLLLMVFVVYGLLPAGRHNPRLQRIGPLFLISNIANASWIVLWHWEHFAASLGVIIVLLVSLLGIYFSVRFYGNPFRKATRASIPKPGLSERMALRLPFSIYLGWIIVASLANLMVWFDRSGRETAWLSLNGWAVIFMVAGTLIAAAFMLTFHDGIVGVVMAVAFAGIAQHAWSDAKGVSIMAIIFAVLTVAIAGSASLMAFDRDKNQTPSASLS